MVAGWLLMLNTGGSLLGAIAGIVLLARPQLIVSGNDFSQTHPESEHAVNRFARIYVVMYAARAITFGLACTVVFGFNAKLLSDCADDSSCKPSWIVWNVVPLLAAAALLQIGDIVVGVRNRILPLVFGAVTALALHLFTALFMTWLL